FSEASESCSPGYGSIKLTGTQIVTPPGQTDQSPVQYSARSETAVTGGQVNKTIDGKAFTEFTVEVQFTQSTNVEAQSRTSRGLVEGEASIGAGTRARDRKSTRLNSSHVKDSYAVFCLKKKKT